MQEVRLTKDEYNEWLRLNSTRRFLNDIWKMREAVKEDLVSGAYPTEKEIHEAVGEAKAYARVLDHVKIIREDFIDDVEASST